jgi:hypothetical protein
MTESCNTQEQHNQHPAHPEHPDHAQGNTQGNNCAPATPNTDHYASGQDGNGDVHQAALISVDVADCAPCSDIDVSASVNLDIHVALDFSNDHPCA